MRSKKNAFTLIELVAVLVIIAIIALIATPLVLSLINNAKASANKRSVDAYGKALEMAAMTYLMDNGEYPTDLSTLEVEYTGKEVTCNVMTLNNDGSIYLSECSVGGSEVKDKNNEDGFYHYGKMVAITYSAYNVGDQITYNGIDFYVITPSDETSDSVTLLKAEPLTVDEVNTYGAGHVNMYVTENTAESYYQKAYDNDGYGSMAYYSSSTCGYDYDSGERKEEGCKTDYDNSEVKYVVDAWANEKLTSVDLKVDSTGYSARLITFDELTTNLGYDAEVAKEEGYVNPSTNGETPAWLYNEYYRYWTMSQYQYSSLSVWDVSPIGDLCISDVRYYYGEGVVRPVITLYKSAL